MFPARKVASSSSNSPSNSDQVKLEPDITFNPNRIFALIDSLLPLRYCLSYQILPLELMANSLTVGMVQLNNPAALNYIRSLCLNKGYSWQLRQIDLQQYNSLVGDYSQNHSRQSVSPVSKSRVQERPTLIIDSPEQLELKTATSDPNLSSLPVSRQNTFLGSETRKLTNLPIKIDLQAQYLSASVEFLATLPAPILWQELLARLLETGKGRLLLERFSDRCRIVWSQNGNLVLAIDPLKPQHFQEVIIEFKRLVNLPLAPIKQVYTGELERSYCQERLLIRWRINPGQYGEEATLQVLQGKALALYQERQMNELEEQALALAQQLERKLNQIRRHRQTNSVPLKELSSLRRLQKLIGRQLELLD